MQCPHLFTPVPDWLKKARGGGRGGGDSKGLRKRRGPYKSQLEVDLFHLKMSGLV